MARPGFSYPGGVRFFLSLALMAGLASCAGEVRQDGGGDSPHTWSLAEEPEVVIGKAAGEAPYLFSAMGPAVLLPGGGVAVSDLDEGVIRIFRPDGSFELEMGGRGEGPGEFEYISRMVLVPPDTLVLHDSGLFRLTRYLTSGGLLSTLSLKAERGRPEVYLGELPGGEMIYSWIRVERRDPNVVTPDAMEFGRFGPSGVLDTVMGSHTGMRRKGSPVAFSPHLFAFLVGDSLFLTNGSTPEIEVWDTEGNHVRTVSVPLPPVEVAWAWTELEDEIRIRANPTEMAFLERSPREEGIPWIGSMLVDDRDRLWVKAFAPRTDNHLLFGDRGTGGEWTVLETDGDVVATLRVPDGVHLQDVRGDRVLGRATDSLGVQQLRVYGLDRSR